MPSQVQHIDNRKSGTAEETCSEAEFQTSVYMISRMWIEQGPWEEFDMKLAKKGYILKMHFIWNRQEVTFWI